LIDRYVCSSVVAYRQLQVSCPTTAVPLIVCSTDCHGQQGDTHHGSAVKPHTWCDFYKHLICNSSNHTKVKLPFSVTTNTFSGL